MAKKQWWPELFLELKEGDPFRHQSMTGHMENGAWIYEFSKWIYCQFKGINEKGNPTYCFWEDRHGVWVREYGDGGEHRRLVGDIERWDPVAHITDEILSSPVWIREPVEYANNGRDRLPTVRTETGLVLGDLAGTVWMGHRVGGYQISSPAFIDIDRFGKVLLWADTGRYMGMGHITSWSYPDGLCEIGRETWDGRYDTMSHEEKVRYAELRLSYFVGRGEREDLAKREEAERIWRELTGRGDMVPVEVLNASVSQDGTQLALL